MSSGKEVGREGDEPNHHCSLDVSSSYTLLLSVEDMEGSISRDVGNGSSTLDDDGDLVSCQMEEEEGRMEGKEKEEGQLAPSLSFLILSSDDREEKEGWDEPTVACAVGFFLHTSMTVAMSPPELSATWEGRRKRKGREKREGELESTPFPLVSFPSERSENRELTTIVDLRPNMPSTDVTRILKKGRKGKEGGGGEGVRSWVGGAQERGQREEGRVVLRDRSKRALFSLLIFFQESRGRGRTKPPSSVW